MKRKPAPIGAFILVFALVATQGPGSAGRAEAWEPQSTRAVFWGVLRWDDASLATWPDAGRSDAVLVETLLARGLPRANLAFLRDEEATREASLKALDRALASSKPGETLIFYYCGHGGRADGGSVVYPYDVGGGGPVSAKELGSRIAAGFRGRLVVLLADCCYSGGLSEAADIIEASGKGALVMASVVSSSVSTGAWTFTDALVDIFRGKIEGDLPGGGIGIGAASGYIMESMRYADRQLAQVYRTASFPADFALAHETPPLVTGRPLFREALYKGVWYPVRILRAEGGKFLVHYLGFDASWDEWLGPERLRLPDFASFPEGATVSVEWMGTWYPATVKSARDGFHLISYDGYGPEWDEWVASPRIRWR